MSRPDLHKEHLPEEFASKLEVQIKSKRPQVAYGILQEAVQHCPEDCLIASYTGVLDVLTGHNREEGLKACEEAVKNAKKAKYKKPVRANICLNLGRAYLASGMKDKAVETFYEGLRLDRDNNDIYWEIKKMGVRRNPPFPFLKRSNPINKLFGILLFRYLGFKGTTVSEEEKDK